MKQILFVVAGNTVQLIELDRLAALLPRERYKCALMLLDAQEMQVIAPRRLHHSVFNRHPLVALVMTFLQKLPLLHRLNIPLRILEARSEALRYFARVHTDLVIVCEESADLECLVTKTARENGIPVLSVPYGAWGPQDRGEAYYHQAHFQVRGRIRERLARKFSKWVYTYRDRRLFHSSPFYIACMELFGASPRNPWFVNTGWVDATAVESPAMREHYLAQGLPEESLTLVGSAALHDLYRNEADKRSLREAFAAEYGLDPDRPIAYCALPPHVEYRPQFLFASSEQTVEAMIRPLLDMHHVQVVFGLHPRESNRKLPCFDWPGVKLHRGKLTDVLPLVDVFVANISASIRWAVALGLPVVNYDAYGFGYTDFCRVSSVHTVADQKGYEEALKALDSPQGLEERSQEAQQFCEYWGKPQGDFVERITALIDRLCAEGKG